MAIIQCCGNYECNSIELIPGLDTVQCLQCGYVTRHDGAVRAPGERFTPTLHEKHRQLRDKGNPNEVPVEVEEIT